MCLDGCASNEKKILAATASTDELNLLGGPQYRQRRSAANGAVLPTAQCRQRRCPVPSMSHPLTWELPFGITLFPASFPAGGILKLATLARSRKAIF